MTFEHLPKNYFGAVLADPPWRFQSWSDKGQGRSAQQHYGTMTVTEIAELPVSSIAADDCVLFLWATWPMLPAALEVIPRWGFEYKTCAFDWMKADASQIEMFRDDVDAAMGLGYWTRSNTEPCLLATRGKPKRLNADVRMGVIEPRREHSRKPFVVHHRIERLVSGPYCELWARQRRPNWVAWGNEVDKFSAGK